MTEEEKALIKIELYNAYKEMPAHSLVNPDARFVLAVKFGLERAQRKLEENKNNRKE
jgi:hypothetical protein